MFNLLNVRLFKYDLSFNLHCNKTTYVHSHTVQKLYVLVYFQPYEIITWKWNAPEE